MARRHIFVFANWLKEENMDYLINTNDIYHKRICSIILKEISEQIEQMGLKNVSMYRAFAYEL
ncbi:MAG: hypothetical protein LBF86_03475 [Helicobacteraceae bacterium]|nr:hypothetical protein [Helicobacteraceae bacterium]